MFYHIIADGRILKNALLEIDTVLGTNAALAASGEERKYLYETMLHDLPYMKAIFHETLRMYPPVPKNGKFAVADDVLPDGTFIEKGDMIAYSDYSLGRSRSVWGEDAEVFSPERWLIDVKDSKDGVKDGATGARSVSPFGKCRVESPHKFHSFNSGPRLCLVRQHGQLHRLKAFFPLSVHVHVYFFLVLTSLFQSPLQGQTFATVEAMVTSCIIIQNYDLKLVPNRPKPEIKASAILPMLRPLLVYATKKSDSILSSASRSKTVPL